ncbi:nuclear transport factor 2 family protein [Sphingomonas sp. 2R-10]|uniref:nuclear transport factor 2 family protein n=1 Tax=Sphingomonas sp. 2R-10 TaxID=3045148 RepID=UPI0019D0358E|nr:nuclear transport factor 2 family protein [Sphingomonas sp. 2R-10]MDJ0278694.1 nuclear transport factor 2 family protein [Sphingomonas sp. 2R-10]
MRKLAIAGIMMVTAVPVAAAPTQDVAVAALIDRFDAARAAFDPAALGATLAPDYVEISPVGTVDPRAAVLTFYQPAAKRIAPPMTVDERIVRVSGTLAVVSERKTMALPNGTVRALRIGYVARRRGGTWQLVSVQYTPIPPAR